MRRLAVAILMPALAAPASALAQDPAPGTPAWHQREAENYAYAQGRAQDRSTHPEAGSPGSVDPLRAIERWNGARGEAIAIEYLNRYRARIVGHLWRPKGPIDGPLPAVVFVNGYGSADDSYFWAAQDLAEHGYLVMTFDPPGRRRLGRAAGAGVLRAGRGVDRAAGDGHPRAGIVRGAGSR